MKGKLHITHRVPTKKNTFSSSIHAPSKVTISSLTNQMPYFSATIFEYPVFETFIGEKANNRCRYSIGDLTYKQSSSRYCVTELKNFFEKYQQISEPHWCTYIVKNMPDSICKPCSARENIVGHFMKFMIFGDDGYL